MLDTLTPLVANDETEIAGFIEKVLPMFKTADGNIKNDISVGIKEYKDSNPREKGEGVQEEDDTTRALREQLEEMKKRLDDADKKTQEAETRRDFISKVKGKGVKDTEWIKSYVSELTLGENFDIDARVDACVKLYNKGEAAKGEKDITPGGAGEGGNQGDKYVANTIAAARALAKSRRLG